MKNIGIHRENNFKYTMVPDVFIEQYMPQASGEFVKVYLLLLKGVSKVGCISISSFADALECTESDILRALNYWKNQGLLGLTYENGELSDIVVMDLSNPLPIITKESGKQIATNFIEPVQTEIFDESLINEKDFSQLMGVIQMYIGTTINPSDCEKITSLHDKLGMSIALLEYIVEYCADTGHRSIRYIESVALDWHKKNIKTVEEAKGYIGIARKDTYAVMKAYGLQGRNPAPTEQKIIDRWYEEYQFSQELIVEACDRTMMTIHKPSFEYTDRILLEWKAQNVQTLADVVRLDEERKKTLEEAKEKKQAQVKSEQIKEKPKSPKVSQTRFHNFEQRDTDYDAILKKLNNSYF